LIISFVNDFQFLSSNWIGDCKSERELVIKLYLPDFSRNNLNNILTDYKLLAFSIDMFV
jgi:hypothetical protein